MLASTIPSPALFIARNNGFAISTPSSEQYNGDGIASRGPGYGIDTVRVDGNDILAVISAVREGRRRCLEQGRAVLIEAMSYRFVGCTQVFHAYTLTPIFIRVGHHSTSDDSFAYRARTEVEDRKRIDNPIVRFRLFMESQGWWDAGAEAEMKARLKADVMKAFKRAENLKRFELGELFTDVYGGKEPWNIVSCATPRTTHFGVLTILFLTDGAKARAYWVVEKIRRDMGAMAKRAWEVQEQGPRSPQRNCPLNIVKLI